MGLRRRPRPVVGELVMAMIGTRGVPARYGGFETAIEEVGTRLCAAGTDVLVFCRGADEKTSEYRGMRLVHLPAVRRKTMETLSHSLLSALHPALKVAHVAFVFNAANALILPLLRLRGIPIIVHVDGLEWQRSKWGRLGRRYYLMCERLAIRWSDAIIADAEGISSYYERRYGATSELISYGAPMLPDSPDDEHLRSLGLEPDGYALVVARFEPENHVLEIVRAYARSSASRPLIVVGSAPYSPGYVAAIEEIAKHDKRIRLVGAVWDQRLLDSLYVGAHVYIHGHSVGGTNPSLLRAMGAGAPTIAYDVVFNREVLGELGRYWAGEGELIRELKEVGANSDDALQVRKGLRIRAAERYDWAKVAEKYEALGRAVVNIKGLTMGRRRH